MAFHFSKYVKYGREGKLRFLRPWIKSYTKKSNDKKHIKHVNHLFLKIKNDAELLDFWHHSYQSYKAMISQVIKSKEDSDFERLENFKVEINQSGIACFLSKHPDCEQGDVFFHIEMQDLESLIDGNIDDERPLPARINAGFKNEKAQIIISTLQNYGFSINDIDEKERSMTLFLSSAFLCPLNRKLTGP